MVTRDGRELVLSRRDDEFRIDLDNHELMSSRAHGSEVALARLALETLEGRPAPRVLVGGLGMGFTLGALLDRLGEHPEGSGATVVVAEFFPAVVKWNRGPLTALSHLARRPLDDPRVRVEVGDVADVVDALAAEAPFDAILLDVDNGPDAFTLDSNHRLYTPAGLERLHRALAPGGVLAVWSADGDPRFERRLADAGYAARARRVPARTSGKGGKHVIFVARK